MTALYINREGERWTLEHVQAHPTFRGMAIGQRRDTGETVTVLARELRGIENENEAEKESEATR